jgi:hypothetical protein
MNINKNCRLNDAKRVCLTLSQFMSTSNNLGATKLREIWGLLPVGEYLYKDSKDKNGLRLYQVCGKSFQETASILYVDTVLSKFIQEYGHRAELAAQNEGIDWKAVSHALRAAYQTLSILTKNTIVFPLPEAEFLKQVKKGELDYQHCVAPTLDRLMDTIEALSAISTLPEKVDREFCENFLISESYFEVNGKLNWMVYKGWEYEAQ